MKMPLRSLAAAAALLLLAVTAQARTETGTISRVDPNGKTITLQMDDGKQSTFTLQQDAKAFDQNGNEVPLRNLTSGQRVTATISDERTGMIERVEVSKAGAMREEQRTMRGQEQAPVVHDPQGAAERRSLGEFETTEERRAGDAPLGQERYAIEEQRRTQPQAGEQRGTRAGDYPQRGDLPRTASALPLLGMFGLAALGCGVALRALRGRGI